MVLLCTLVLRLLTVSEEEYLNKWNTYWAVQFISMIVKCTYRLIGVRIENQICEKLSEFLSLQHQNAFIMWNPILSNGKLNNRCMRFKFFNNSICYRFLFTILYYVNLLAYSFPISVYRFHLFRFTGIMNLLKKGSLLQGIGGGGLSLDIHNHYCLRHQHHYRYYYIIHYL